MPHRSPGPRVVGVEILANQVACRQYYDIILANRYIFVDIFLLLSTSPLRKRSLARRRLSRAWGAGAGAGAGAASEGVIRRVAIRQESASTTVCNK